MPERLRAAGLRAILVAASAALLSAAPATAAPSLEGSLVGGATFPSRALVLWDSSPAPLSASQLTVTENGGPVADLHATPITQAARRDFGVMLVVDQSAGMSGGRLAAEMGAAQALAAARTGNQQLGLMTFDSKPSLILPLTDRQRAISSAVTSTPWTGPGERVLPAVSLAVQQLKRNVTAGAVIVVGSGAAQETGGSLTPASVAAAARAAGIRIYTVGLRNRHYSRAAMTQLANTAGGTFTEAKPSQLGGAVGRIWAALTWGYVVRYRSLQPLGHAVEVSVHAAGLTGTATASYASPAPPPRPMAAPRPQPFPVPSRLLSATPPVRLPDAVLQPSAAPAQPGSFWASSRSVGLVSVGCALLLGLAVALFLVPRSKRAVHTRVENFIAVPPEPHIAHGYAAEPPRGRIVAAIASRPWWPEFVEQVQVGRLKRSPEQLVKLTILGSVGAAFVATILSGSVLLAVPALLIGPLAARAAVRRTVRRQREAFSEQLPSHLQDLAGAMRAGRSIVGGLAAVAESADEPMRGELERALADERLGLTLEESLRGIARRMQSEDIEQVALIAALHRRSGSNVAEALDRVAEGSRDRADMRRELSALTGQARISSWVLTALPPVLLVATSLIDPKYARPMFHSVAGIVVLVMCALMVVSGWFVMKKIVNVEV
jgi:tight adherence protein B